MFALRGNLTTPHEAFASWRIRFPQYDELSDLIEEEVRRSVEKERISTRGETMNIESVRFVLEEETYERIKKTFLHVEESIEAEDVQGSKDSSDVIHPMLVFHSTQNINKVNGILRHGYILPGQNHPTQGWTLRMQNGNVYGDGIYCSNHFDVASWYSFVDFESSIQLIVNILIPGKTLVSHPYSNYSTSSVSLHLAPDEGIYYRRRFHDQDGVEEDTFHTLRSDDMRIWVAGSSDRIIPVGVVTLRPLATQGDAVKRYASLSSPGPRSEPDEKIVLHHFGYDLFLVATEPVVWPRLEYKSAYTLLVASILRDEAISQELGEVVPTPQDMIANGKRELKRIMTHVGGYKPRDVEAATILLLKMSQHLVDHYDGEIPVDRHAIEDTPGVGNRAANIFWDHTCADTELRKQFRHSHRQELLHPRHVLVLPQALFHNTTFAQNVANFINGFEDNSTKLLAVCKTKSADIIPLVHQNSLMQAHHATPLTKEEEGLVGPLSTVIDHITDENDNERYVNIMYLIVHKPCDLDQVDDLIRKWEVYLRFKLISVKLVFMDEVRQDVCRLKSYLQVRLEGYVNSSHRYFYQTTPNELSDVLNDISDDVEYNQLLQGSTSLSVAFPYGVVGEGFLKTVGLEPSWDVIAQKAVLFKGCPPRVVKRDYRYYETFVNESPSPEHFEQFGQCIFRLLAAFQNFMFRSPDRVRIYGRVISDLAQKLLSRIESLQESGAAAPSILKGMKYKLSGFLGSMTTFGNISFKGKWYSKLQNMKYGKKVARRVKMQFDLCDLPRALAQHCLVREPSDCLLVDGRPGRLIRVVTFPGSEIEPWLIVVDYVSFDMGRTNEMFAAGEKDEKTRDSRGRAVTDVMLPVVGKGDSVAHMYHGYVFTRTPYLYIPSQHPSLVVNTMTTCVETAFRICVEHSSLTHAGKLPGEAVEEVTRYVEIAFGLLSRIRELMGSNETIHTWIAGVSNTDSLERYFTEALGVQSINQFLAALLLPQAAHLPKSDRWPRLCFGLLAEAVMRNCRARAKASKYSADQLIDKVLSIKRGSTEQNYERNIKRASQRTNSTMTHSFTNCSPFKTVGVLYFVQLVHENAQVADVVGAFVSGRASMSRFLRDFLPGFGGYITQLALYLQGMNSMKAKYRLDFRFNDPKATVDDVIKLRLKHHELERLQRSQSIEKRQRRRMIRRTQAEKFKTYHTHPTLFTPEEVDVMNKARAPDDQLELMKNGLLVHHCCYPNCPDYLCNFATEKDRRFSRRNGLMKHLKHDYVLGNMAKGWHNNCSKHARTLSVEAFVRHMKRAYPSLAGCEEYARVQHQQYHELGEKRKK